MRTVDRMDARPIDVPRGLTNVVVTETALGDVRGQEGFYHYRQYSGVELARTRSVEDVWALLLDGALPDAAAGAAFRASVERATRLPDAVSAILPAVSALCGRGDALAGVRVGVSALGAARGSRPLFDLTPEERRDEVVDIAAKVPSIIAAVHRLRSGLEPVPPRPRLGFAGNYLYMLNGEVAPEQHVRALSAYLVAAIDHGFNASTFTARVIASTGADAASCFTGALGSLSGPLHGGAPSRALDTLDAIGRVEDIDPWIRARLAAGERIMGFGHPVYRTEDPRSALLKDVARGFDSPRVRFAIQVEERIPVLLEQVKPGRHLHTNLEWYAAVVMEQIGLDRSLFSPTFAAARVLGWSANILEQAADTKIIRPSARYVGPPAPQPVPRA